MGGKKNNSNSYGLRAGQLSKGGGKVGSVAQAQAGGVNASGVKSGADKKLVQNAKKKQRVQSLWGK